MAYPKRYYTTNPLRLGNGPEEFFQFIEPPATTDQLDGMALTSFELITPTGEWFPASVQPAYRNFSRVKTNDRQLVFIGGHEITLADGNAMVQLHLVADLTTGLLTSSVQVQLPGSKVYVPLAALPTFKHMLGVFELKMQLPRD